jgi:hypothetical protein
MKRRSLTDDERALLAFLLELAPAPVRRRLRAQATTAVVTRVCECGCGRFSISVERTRPPIPAAANPLADAVGLWENEPVNVMLVVNPGGYLAGLELVWLKQG